RSQALGRQSRRLAVLIGDFAPSFESASWNPWAVAALPSGMSWVSPRDAPLDALVGGELTLITSEQQTLTADDAGGGFSASAVVTVQGAGPVPGCHGGVDTLDALFVVRAAEWSGRWDQGGAPAFWNDWTTA